MKNGDSYEIHPTGFDLGDSRISVDMDVVVPKKSVVTVRNDRGGITVSDMATDVTVSTQNGDIEINDTTGNVDVSIQKGDVKVTDTKGDVKVSGHGGEVEVVNATGSLTVDGEFYSSMRADKIAKGIRFISQRTDLTLSQLGGHFEKSSGNLEIADASGITLQMTRNCGEGQITDRGENPNQSPAFNSVYVVPAVNLIPVQMRLFTRVTFDQPRAHGFP